MAAPVQGAVQFQDLQADSEFLAAPPQEQVQFLMEDYLPQRDPEFAKAPANEKLQYINEVVLPQVQPSKVGIERFIDRSKPLNTAKLPQAVGTPGGFAPTTIEGLEKFQAGQAFGLGQTLKGATLGYVDPVSKVHEAYPDQNLTELTKSPISQIPEFAGSALPLMGLGAAVEAAAPLNPLTARVFGTTAEAAGQHVPLLAQMARGATELGLYEGLKSHPQNQFDLSKRIIEGAGGALTGALLPAAMAGGGKVLQAGAKFSRDLMDEAANIFKPNEQAINFISQGVKRETAKALRYLDSVWTKLQRGEIDPKLVTADDYASLVTKMEELSQALKTGKSVNPKKAIQAGARIERKAQIRSRVQKRPIESAENVQKREAQHQQRQQPAEGAKETKQPEAPATKPEQKEKVILKGSIKEMVEQGLEDFGGSLKEAKALLAEVKALGKAEDDPVIKKIQEGLKDNPEIEKLEAEIKALGRKPETKAEREALRAQINQIKKDAVAPRKAERQALRDKAAEIHGNLREVLGTDWDGSSPLADQLPVDPKTQLKAEQVESLITSPHEKAIFGKVSEAVKAGRSLRVEHQAEITGSTDAAAKITSAGNTKVPVSTFTPTHFTVTTKEFNGVERQYVAAHGYNEAGHMSKYYINKTPEGSQILKVNKELPNEAFVGVTPNVELGQRKYKVADVLGRAEREEGVLTSDALKNAKAFAEIFKPENLNKFSKITQAELKAFRKRGKFDKRSFQNVQKQLEKYPEDMKQFCSLFGLA